MKIKYLLYILVVFSLVAFGCAQKTSTELMKNMEIEKSSIKDVEFKKMCQNAGYEWMFMKPTQNGKFIKDAEECMGCMVKGIEHVCDKEKFMKLMGKDESKLVAVQLNIAPEQIKPNEKITLTFKFEDAEGKPLSLQREHEKLIHTIIINDDFSIFSHLHPEDSGLKTKEMQSEGIYSLDYTFAKVGKYLVGVDFSADNEDYAKLFYADVVGNITSKIKKDLSTQKTFNRYAVNLSLPPKVFAGKETTLTYYFTKDKKPLTDMQPYLGAAMHLAVVRDDLTNFIHTHATADDMSMNEMMDHSMMEMNQDSPPSFGPRLVSDIVFPEKGLYNVFGEFKHNGKVIVTSFMVEVE